MAQICPPPHARTLTHTRTHSHTPCVYIQVFQYWWWLMWFATSKTYLCVSMLRVFVCALSSNQAKTHFTAWNPVCLTSGSASVLLSGSQCGWKETLSTSAVMQHPQHPGANSPLQSFRSSSPCTKQSESVCGLGREGTSSHPVGPRNRPVGSAVLPDAFAMGGRDEEAELKLVEIKMSRFSIWGETKMKDQEGGGWSHWCTRAEWDCVELV